MRGETTPWQGKGNSAAALAETVAQAYVEYVERFTQLTRKARERFESRDWLGAQRDALNRLLLYGHRVDRTVDVLLTAGAVPHSLGPEAKRRYGAWCGGRDDVELAQTFYNSVIRRAYGIAGVLPEVEFVGAEVSVPRTSAAAVARAIPVGDGLAPAIAGILTSLPFAARVADAARDAELAAHALAAAVAPEVERIDVLPSVFYRGKGAYVVGRLHTQKALLPLLLCLIHDDDGVRLDAVLWTPDEASIVFGFTRAYFHTELMHPRATVDYLQSIMPLKRVDELYTSLGHNRHGKTELHRALMHYLHSSGARLEVAPGDPGLVMSVFSLPGFNVVFKVIRDRFGAPKRVTRRQVMEKYMYIFRRDRVGRLADAQEFRHLELPRSAFTDEVIAELRREASETVQVDGQRVVFDHLYTERRVVPLNLYLREANEAAAMAAMVDYGNAIKELAAANIFPGDMLFKNFGVTRHGRVIFYDYDEVEDLTDCVFRAMPRAAHEQDELAAEPWFPVGEHDVFPEEFARYMLLPGRLGHAFESAHADLLDIHFWHGMQELQREGAVVDFFPYSPERRLAGG